MGCLRNLRCLGRGYGITTDNLVISFALSNELSGRGLALCSILRENKKGIPHILQPNKHREENSSIFIFHKNITLVSYGPKTGKAVKVLSTELKAK